MARPVNAAGQALVKSFEQCRLVGYLPTPDDVPTIGWGHTGADVHIGQHITQEQADAMFARDLNDFAYHVDQLLAGCPTTDNQFAAMVSLAYNVGIGSAKRRTGFISSNVLACHLRRDFEGAANSFKNWTKQNGKVLGGLVRRRNAERDLYRSR
jgi:lysozyme